MNPVYQNLRLALSNADADLAALRGHIASQQGVVADLRSKVQAVPEIEAELTRLNRDYEINKQQYDTLAQRLESARISEQAEQNAENVKFRVIEPPVEPVKPSGPNRLALNSLVLLGALGAGLGLALLLAQLHPTFSTRDVLARVTGIPVFGSISAAIRAGATPWYRTQTALVAAAVSLLVAVYGLNVALTEPLRAALRTIQG
jgi:polysaccharide chain length determinant protein (PEP-CTERM system associated)